MYLDGSSAPGITIAAPAGSNMRLFYVAHGTVLDLFDVNLTGGNLIGPSVAGGAIYADGELNVFSSTTTRSQAPARSEPAGGAVYIMQGGLYALGSTFAYNSATGSYAAGGGAIYSTSYMSLLDDTIAGNSVNLLLSHPAGSRCGGFPA